MKNIPKFFPPYNETEFINKVKEEYKNEKEIKGELSDIWMFSELESKPKPCKEKLDRNEKFDNVTVKTNEEKLNLNLKILEIQDLSTVNTLEKIISVLKNGYSISKEFIFYIEKLEKEKINKIFNYLYEIYSKTKNSTNSILSNEIKIFSNKFEDLCQSLIDSKVNLDKFDELPN